MDTPIDSAEGEWVSPPTLKERNAVQRAVTALLDELAPERETKRGERLPTPVERHRTPNGCVLQAAAAALSVSWFPDSAELTTLGELHVVVWRGVVSRRGSAPRREGATVAQELVLRPMERSADECVWRATDGSTYDTPSLVARCLALLDQQQGESGAAQDSAT
jgi:hypothetical protein